MRLKMIESSSSYSRVPPVRNFRNKEFSPRFAEGARNQGSEEFLKEPQGEMGSHRPGDTDHCRVPTSLGVALP